MSIHKANVFELAAAAYEMEAGVLQGVLTRAQDGSWRVGEVTLDEWLSRYNGHELVLIAASLSEEREYDVQVCQTCGREYVGSTCPYCRSTWRRLRGR
ncbi:MAG: hypothetical protein D6759_18660 [Chloroflexi bacterium]|nr:MAG: hypothetical protein D6759_18660 [Chloroflexota bacterium]